MVEQVYSSEKSQVCGSWVSVCTLGCFYNRVTNNVCRVCLSSVDIFNILMLLHTVQALFVLLSRIWEPSFSSCCM
jgi:hypothetical protein